MSYSSNYYNYQIAVIFAILVAALLVLGAVVLAIYYVVSAMREKKGDQLTKYYRGHSDLQYQPAQSLYHQAQAQPPSAVGIQYLQQQQPLQYYGVEPEPEQGGGGRVKELQPEYTYQGQTGWTNISPIGHLQQQQHGQNPSAHQPFHMSSV